MPEGAVPRDQIKHMTHREFRELGLLQEINRRLLHPMGMALSMVADETGELVGFGEIWDYRDDPDGMVFDEVDSDMIARGEKVEQLFQEALARREKRLGFRVQPLVLGKVPDQKEE